MPTAGGTAPPVTPPMALSVRRAVALADQSAGPRKFTRGNSSGADYERSKLRLDGRP